MWIPRAPLARSGVRLRATVAATLTVAVALGLASAALIAVLYGNLESTARAEAADKATAGVQAIRLNPAGGIPAPELQPGSAPLPPPSDVQVVSVTKEGTGWLNGADYVVVGKRVETPRTTLVVQGRASLAPARQAINTLRDLLIPGIPALLLLVALLTWAAVGRVLKPVSAIRSKMAEITAHDLHQRVPEPGSRDEIAALARTVNATLDRLQAAVEQHRRFVADAAHELRSPLATLRTRLELAPPEKLTEQALTDVARLQTLTADLLFLARLDAGEPLRDQEIDLAQVTAEEAARTRPRPEVKIEMRIAPDVLVRGSGDHLRRLVANLVDNAVRHATRTVTVRLSATTQSALLTVEDDGPGIPEEHHETIFDRFARLDEARDRDHGGSGLGLAIARDVATAHGGTLKVGPSDKGACLLAVLPVATPARLPAPDGPPGPGAQVRNQVALRYQPAVVLRGSPR